MRIGLVSDLHLSVKGLEFPRADVDVLVLAGDISRPERAMEWARATPVPTVYVAGNHEFYGSDLVTTYKALEEGAAGAKSAFSNAKNGCTVTCAFSGAPCGPTFGSPIRKRGGATRWSRESSSPMTTPAFGCHPTFPTFSHQLPHS